MAKKSKKAKKADKDKKKKKREAAEAVSSATVSAILGPEIEVNNHPLLLRGREISAREQGFSHPWNPNSELIGVRLGRELGLKRTGVSIARIPSGKESYVPHAHHREEEWLYILSGEGLAIIGDEAVRVRGGDFLAFPAPQVAHHLKNAGEVDLVYLMGGENAKMDVVDFPTLGKRTVRLGDRVTVYDMASGEDMVMPKPKKKKKKD
ncbi:MAG: cupin domain-containing protein [Terricaulis silvestris]